MGRILVSAVVITNLVCNLLFFLSHPIFARYYLMPMAMLSLWSLLFRDLMDGRTLSRDTPSPYNPTRPGPDPSTDLPRQAALVFPQITTAFRRLVHGCLER